MGSVRPIALLDHSDELVELHVVQHAPLFDAPGGHSSVVTTPFDDLEDVVVSHGADAFIGQAGIGADALAVRAVANYAIFSINDLSLFDRLG